MPAYELIYTSCDDGRNRGGWGVKCERAGSDAAAGDRAALLAGVRPELSPVVDLPQFPTELDRLAFPRRLEHRPIGSVRSGIWHTVPAGLDCSGRPGNVVVSACALSAPAALSVPAVDYWRSASWPTPFGAAEVVQTELPEVPSLQPGPLADLTEVVDFLFPPLPQPLRVTLIGPLLDATLAALESDDAPGIALIVDDCEEAASWIAAICAFAPPSWAAKLSWSTFERARALGNPAVRKLNIVAVPRADRDLLIRSSYGRLVVDCELDLTGTTDEPVWDDALEQPAWRFAAGGAAAQQSWSQQVREQCEPGADAVLPLLRRLRELRWPGTDAADVFARLAQRPVSEHLDVTYVTLVLESDLLQGAEPVDSRMVDPGLAVPAAQVKVSQITGSLQACMKSGSDPSELQKLGARVIDFLAACGVTVDSSQLQAVLTELQAAEVSGPEVASAELAVAEVGSAEPGSRQEGCAESAQYPVPLVPAAPVQPDASRRYQPEPKPTAQAGQLYPDRMQDQMVLYLRRNETWAKRRMDGSTEISHQAENRLNEAYFITSKFRFFDSPALTKDPRERLCLAVLALHACGGLLRNQRSPGDCYLLIDAFREICKDDSRLADPQLCELAAFYAHQVICALMDTESQNCNRQIYDRAVQLTRTEFESPTWSGAASGAPARGNPQSRPSASEADPCRT